MLLRLIQGDESLNILHLKYAVSIADNGSINKAAVDQYGHEALEKTIADAVSMLR